MTPKLTIGLIIYNGVGSAHKCINSLLSQTFEDFELLIFDNASTDGTSEVCAEFAAQDRRVKHVRHNQTIPQSENFRGVLMAAQTDYFMWAADDDIWSPNFAQYCISALEEHPQAVACCTKVTFRYPDGAERPARGTFAITGSPKERVREYLKNPRDSARLYGVYRTALLKKSYPSSINMFAYDWVVVCLSMLYGDHLEIDSYQLLRSGHAPGKYFEKYDRHFVREKGFQGLVSWFLPLYPLTKALRNMLPPEIWRAARYRVLRLNIIQTLLLLVWKYPKLRFLFNFGKALDRVAEKSLYKAK